jgi:hypothetical protein
MIPVVGLDLWRIGRRQFSLSIYFGSPLSRTPDEHVPRQDSGTLTGTAPDSITRWIVTLNAWRIANTIRRNELS